MPQLIDVIYNVSIFENTRGLEKKKCNKQSGTGSFYISLSSAGSCHCYKERFGNCALLKIVTLDWTDVRRPLRLECGRVL